jgi:hypothetical protein
VRGRSTNPWCTRDRTHRALADALDAWRRSGDRSGLTAELEQLLGALETKPRDEDR